MQTKNLIQMQANILNITTLRKGNVIKMLEKEYSDSYKPMYGIVLDLYNTGTQSYVEILKYEKSYNEIKASIKVYSGDVDLSIFPASKDEVQSYFEDTLSALKKTIHDKKEELCKLENGYSKALEFTSGELEKQITEVDYTEMTQIEFDNKRKELE